MTLTIDFTIEDRAWAESAPWYRERALLAAGAALQEAGVEPMQTEISVLLCDNARIAELNTTHRGKSGATNVLSWPAESLLPADAPLKPADGFLGDLALARETIEIEAFEQQISVEDHVTHLIAHGVLHLLGYDHETEADAEAMEEMERRALASLGIADPYATDPPAR